jgi:hypothetical protein
MNKRIRELVEQAHQKEVWGNNPYNGSPEFEGYELDAEKFAELIVRECSRVIVNGGYRTPPFRYKHPLTPPEIAKMIEKHFGVEE